VCPSFQTAFPRKAPFGDPRAVVFDLGGVVVDWNPRHLYRKLFADCQQMEDFLTEVDFFAWNLEQDRGRPFAEGVRTLTERFPHRAPLISAYQERWDESINGPIEGTLDVIHDLGAAGYSLHALTNWSVETFGQAERRFGFSAIFEQVVVSGYERICKPDPRIYRILLERTGLEPRECVFVDDSPVNVQAAADLGIQALHFTSPRRLRHDLREAGISVPGQAAEATSSAPSPD
jgi:2-haloacid dehalogenase